MENDETFEHVMSEIKKLDSDMALLMAERKKLMAKLSGLEKDAFEWMSVQKASSILELSPTTIYNWVNAGRLRSRTLNGRVYVSKKEVMGCEQVSQ